MRLKVRSSVLLPQPDGPMKAVTLRSGMSRLMFFSAWKLAVVEVQVAHRDLARLLGWR
jgi:hypothetical protein